MPKPRMEISHITCQEDVAGHNKQQEKGSYRFLGLAGTSTVERVEQ